MELIRKVWAFLSALFWLERLDRLAQEKRWFVFKLLPWRPLAYRFTMIIQIKFHSLIG